MSHSLYYTAPPQEVFDDIKENAIKIWQTYDNTHGYVDMKLHRIKDLENISDNWMYMVVMFDSNNQEKLFNMVNPLTKILIEGALK